MRFLNSAASTAYDFSMKHPYLTGGAIFLVGVAAANEAGAIDLDALHVLIRDVNNLTSEGVQNACLTLFKYEHLCREEVQPYVGRQIVDAWSGLWGKNEQASCDMYALLMRAFNRNGTILPICAEMAEMIEEPLTGYLRF